jgi:FlaG/FlaF family flagellin (archaellin)
MVVRALLISVAFSAVLAAQGSGVIFGNVTDSSGSAVPSAAITLTNEATQISESVKSNEQGYYLFPDVRAGNYRLAAEAQGFRTA